MTEYIFTCVLPLHFICQWGVGAGSGAGNPVYALSCFDGKPLYMVSSHKYSCTECLLLISKYSCARCLDLDYAFSCHPVYALSYFNGNPWFFSNKYRHAEWLFLISKYRCTEWLFFKAKVQMPWVTTLNKQVQLCRMTHKENWVTFDDAFLETTCIFSGQTFLFDGKCINIRCLRSTPRSPD